MRIGDGTAGEEGIKSLRFNGLMVRESTKIIIIFDFVF
jgi:hypothetical protein